MSRGVKRVSIKINTSAAASSNYVPLNKLAAAVRREKERLSTWAVARVHTVFNHHASPQIDKKQYMYTDGTSEGLVSKGWKRKR